MSTGSMSDVASSQEQLHLQGAIAANMAQGVVLIRASDCQIVYVNDALEKMFGYDSGEMAGRHAWELNAPTDRSPEQTAADIADAVERNGAWHGEIENVRKDGAHFWCWANISAFDHPEHGTVWIGVHTDITEHRQADEVLREAEERFRRVFEDGPTGIVMISAGMRIIEANTAFARILGVQRGELIGRHLDEITNPDDVSADADLARRLFAGQISSYRVEKRYRVKKGRTVWVSLTAGLVRDSAGKVLYGLGIVEDIDQRKLGEVLLRRENERLSGALENSLRELRRSRARILASADQERRRIERDLHDGAQHRLVALQIRLALGREVLERDPGAADDLVTSLTAEVEAALEDVRLLARGVYPSVLADHGLVGALRAAARNSPVPVTVRARGIARYPEEIETAVYFACTEALQNAAKHATGSAVSVSLDGNGELRFSVRDKGIGFSPVHAALGKGLSNMRDRVEAVGGTLTIDSAPGKGTNVTGVIPLG